LELKIGISDGDYCYLEILKKRQRDRSTLKLEVVEEKVSIVEILAAIFTVVLQSSKIRGPFEKTRLGIKTEAFLKSIPSFQIFQS